MILMIVIALLLIIILGLAVFIQRNIILPENINAEIAKIKNDPLPELMPGEIDHVTIDDVVICYERIEAKIPNGETVFLLHGLSQTMLSFPPYFYQPFLDAGFRVIRIDHRGVGGSSWMDNWSEGNKYQLEDMGNDAFNVANKLGLESFHLIGISMGGMIAQHMALDYPDRIKSLTSIMSTGFYYDPELTNVPVRFKRDFVLSQLIYGRKLETLEQKLKIHIAINKLQKGDDSYEYDAKTNLEKATYEIKKRNGFTTKAIDQHSYAVSKSGSRLERLKNLKVSTLIVHGKADPLVVFPHGEKCANAIPNSKTLFLDGMGHDLHKHFCDRITNTIIEHLKDNSSKKNQDSNQSIVDEFIDESA